jgi:hypothetical protein
MDLHTEGRKPPYVRRNILWSGGLFVPEPRLRKDHQGYAGYQHRKSVRRIADIMDLLPPHGNLVPECAVRRTDLQHRPAPIQTHIKRPFPLPALIEDPGLHPLAGGR